MATEYDHRADSITGTVYRGEYDYPREEKTGPSARVIPQESERLAKALAVLCDTIGTAADRLAPVLAPEGPTAAPEDGNNLARSNSDIAETLRTFTSVAEEAHRRLAALLDRVEL